MKLEINKQYKIDNDIVTYTGYLKFNHKCMLCHKERYSLHCFTVGGTPDNPDFQDFYGSECIKKLNIKPI